MQQAWRSRSVAEGEKEMKLQNSAINYRRVMSENHAIIGMHLSSPGRGSPCSSLNQDGNSDWDNRSRRSPSAGSRFSTCSSSDAIDDSALNPLSSTPGSEICFALPMLQQNHGQHRPSSAASSAIVSTLL